MDDSSLQLLKETRFNIFNLFKLEYEQSQNALNWYRSVGLIAPSYECPDCGRNMNLVKVKSDNGYEWQCSKSYGSNQHNTSRSVIEGSCFTYSRLNIHDTLILMHFWLLKMKCEDIKTELSIDDEMIIADCCTFCREICVIDLVNNSDKIGGKGINIEMDVCKLGEMKYVRDKLPNGQWVFGGYERKTSKYFIKIVENNTKQELLKIIGEWVQPGSVIISDCWKLYNCHSDEDFIHLCSANSLTFHESERNKSIEAARAVFKGPLASNVDVVFCSYLGEHIWRKKHDNLNYNKKFQVFLKAIIESYKPLCKDCQQ